VRLAVSTTVRHRIIVTRRSAEAAGRDDLVTTLTFAAARRSEDARGASWFSTELFPRPEKERIVNPHRVRGLLGSLVLALSLAGCSPGNDSSIAAASSDLASPTSMSDFPPLAVTYAEVSFGCDGSTPTTDGTPAINLRPGDGSLGEVRISGDAASQFSAASQSVDYSASPDRALSLGTLATAPSCTVLDTGDPVTPSWNAISLSSQVSMTLEQVDHRYILEIRDLTRGQRYTVSF
jgi:hypothetical protein